jgi:hypothetical protein
MVHRMSANILAELIVYSVYGLYVSVGTHLLFRFLSSIHTTAFAQYPFWGKKTIFMFCIGFTISLILENYWGIILW